MRQEQIRLTNEVIRLLNVNNKWGENLENPGAKIDHRAKETIGRLGELHEL